MSGLDFKELLPVSDLLTTEEKALTHFASFLCPALLGLILLPGNCKLLYRWKTKIELEGKLLVGTLMTFSTRYA